MKSGEISIRKQTIAKLLREVDVGQFAVPHLQREFVWDGSKAAKLLDSIFKAMPVGIVLIWDTPRSKLLYLRQRFHVLPPFNNSNRRVWFLIDGQQRVSALYHAREGDTLTNASGRKIDFSRVVLSLNQKEDAQIIRYRSPLPGEYVSLSTVLHPRWRQKLKGLGRRKLERISASRQRILGYHFFMMFVYSGISDIRETFLRINTQGMKIATADAIFTRAEVLKLRDIVHEVREHLDDAFDGVPDQPILFVFSAIQGNSDPRGRAIDAVISKLNKEATTITRLRKSLAKDWNRLGPCFGKAADYLRKEFCVVSREYLASDYMLSMLAYFFFYNGGGPSGMQKEEMRKWFWATSVGSRYSGGDFSRCVPEDLKFFKSLARNSSRRFHYDPQVEMVDVRKAQYASPTAITSAVYCMLLCRGPVRLLDKGLNEIPIDRYSTRANRKDRHHIFPRQPLANLGIPAKQYNSISNICMLVAEENQIIGSKQPSKYLRKINLSGFAFRKKMARHLIPVDDASGIWISNLRTGFRRFQEARTKLICNALEEQAGIRLFRAEAQRS